MAFTDLFIGDPLKYLAAIESQFILIYKNFGEIKKKKKWVGSEKLLV
jgi:hypothetical protein